MGVSGSMRTLMHGMLVGSIRRPALVDATNPAMPLLFQTRCPHCRARVGNRDKTCPRCDRWMDDHPDWIDSRKLRRRATTGAVLFLLAVLLIWILTRR